MPPFRSTQRAPASCFSCYKRKVKCNREIPCQQCIDRGSAGTCKREVVFVRGKLQTADTSASSPSYDALLFENTRLTALVSAPDSAHKDESTGPSGPATDPSEHFEKQLSEVAGRRAGPRTVLEPSDVLIPSKRCSDAILAHAQTWTSWIHFAMFFPHFLKENEAFWIRGAVMDLTAGGSDVLWLAVYFSVLSSTLLFMDPDEYLHSNPPHDSQQMLMRNWYETSLFFLDKADYMQQPSVKFVRAVTILGIVATNVGDSFRHSVLWACAIRVAFHLELGSDRHQISESTLEREIRRRLWWTLVLCEWLAIPTRAPCIHDTDFDCELPADLDDEELHLTKTSKSSHHRPRQIQYHILMCRIAIVMFRFRYTLRLRPWSPSQIADIVLKADNQLASLISELPPHLQNDEPETEQTLERDRSMPWIPWQKTSLSLVFLDRRIAINRILQAQWLRQSLNYARSRSICLGSAIAITRAASESLADVSKMRPWALGMHVFSASVTLLMELQGGQSMADESRSALQAGINFLERVESENMIAQEGLKILRGLMQTEHFELMLGN